MGRTIKQMYFHRLAKFLSFLTLCCLTLSVTLPVIAVESEEDSLEQSVAFLLQRIRESELTFIRNGTKFSGDDTAKHIAQKYDHYKEMIYTPDDFIRIAGSKSLSTGRLYLVEQENGIQIYAAAWLREQLKDFSPGPLSASPPAEQD